ncbi:MAG: asparagine synthase [Burkholderiaceae bacterium]|nr:asparagine synthase [Burkholderiaceae bacterium]
MKDELSGHIDLTRLFDSTPSDTAWLDSLALHGAHIARDAHLACVLLGDPQFDDADALQVVANSGPAAGFLQLWRRHGEKACQRLRGGYSVVLIDRLRPAVFLCVDRFAIQTLCYSHDEGRTLSFSNRADCVQGRGTEFDSQSIFDYLFFHMIPAPRTIFAKVRRLPAAHSLLIDREGAHLQRHWPLRFDERNRQGFDEARDSFRQIIKAAVQEEIAGQGTVGTFLSGGTDSSTVTGMLREVTGQAPKAYSIGFEAEGYDEMEYARLAARHFGCEHHEYYVTPADLLASIPAVAQYHDQPFGNSSSLPSYYCAKMAKEDGCDKILAGDGGDELFGGNSRYAMQKVFEYYHALPSGLRAAIEPFCGDTSVLRRIPGLRQMTGYVRHSKSPLPDRLQNYNLVMQLNPATVLTADFLSTVDIGQPMQHMRSTWNECEQPVGLVNHMLAYDWRYTLADSDLPKVRGATSMAGIAVGYPMLADRLADFSMRLDPHWKLKRFKLRWFFKEALRGFLPDEIITKKKQGFGLPYGPWMSRDPALKRLALDSLQGLVARGIVRADFVQALMGPHLQDHPGYYGEMVWILMMLEQWLRGQDDASQAATAMS